MLRAENSRHNSLTLRQVPPVLQRILPRAKRKPGSLHNASVPEDSPALCVGGGKEILKSRLISKSHRRCVLEGARNFEIASDFEDSLALRVDGSKEKD